jgi:hypothetical protein
MQKTEVQCNVSQGDFLEIAWKLVRQRFVPPAHQNAQHDPQISLDAETQVRRNVSRHAYYGNCTRPT